ncbi:MAG: hypothetical protein WCN95_10885 [bacterium]
MNTTTTDKDGPPDELWRTGLDRRVLSLYPTIIAQSYRYFIEQANPLVRLHALICGPFQHTLKYLSLVALSEYCNQTQSSPRLNDVILDLRHPQYGHWVAFLHAAQEYFKTNPPELFAEAGNILMSRTHPELNIAHLLDSLVAVKNSKISHGAGPQQAEREALDLLVRWEPALLAWIDDLEWLCAYPLHVRKTDGKVWKLMGEYPTQGGPAAPAVDEDLDLFFCDGKRLLRAFPFYFWLPDHLDKVRPGLFLFQGATDKLICYLSHDSQYSERNGRTVELLKDLLDKKHIELAVMEQDIPANQLVDESHRSTVSKLARLTREGRYDLRRLARRAEPDAVFNTWLRGQKPGLIISGAAGSGKSFCLYSWAEDLLKTRHAVVLFQGRDIPEPTPETVTTAIRRSIGWTAPMERILGNLQQDDRSLFVIVDAAEDCSSPQNLVTSLIDLIDEHRALPLRIVLSVRDVSYHLLPRKTLSEVESHKDQLACFISAKDINKTEHPYYLLKRLDDDELATFVKIYGGVYGVPCSLQEIDASSRNILRNPFILRLAFEAYRDGKFPSHLSAHKLFSAFMTARLGNGGEEGVDRSAEAFLGHVVGLLLENRSSQLDINVLYHFPATATAMLSTDPDSPFVRLLDEGVVVEVCEKDALFGSRRWVRVNYDIMLEVLLLRQLQDVTTEALVEMVRAKPLYAPLSGVLTLRLILDGEGQNIQPFRKLALHLSDPDVARALQRALEHLCYTNTAFVGQVLHDLADEFTEPALAMCLAILSHAYDAGQWTWTDDLYQPLRTSKATSTPNCATGMAHINLTYAVLLFAQAKCREALLITEQYAGHSDPGIRARAVVIRTDILDSTDREKYLESARECCALGRRDDDADLLAFGLWSVGGYYEYCGRSEEAVREYEEIFRMAAGLAEEGKTLGLKPYEPTLASVYRWYARALCGIPERCREAEASYLRALSIDEAGNRLYLVSVDWNNLADYYLRTGDLDKAILYSDKEFSQRHLFACDPEWAFTFFSRFCMLFSLRLAGRPPHADPPASAAECIASSVRIGEQQAERASYLHLSYLGAICCSLAQGETGAAADYLSRLTSYGASMATTAPHSHEIPIVTRYASLVTKLFREEDGSDDLSVLIKDSRDAGLIMSAIVWVGLVVTPLLLVKPRATNLPGVMSLVRKLAEETGNSFWLTVPSGRVD